MKASWADVRLALQVKRPQTTTRAAVRYETHSGSVWEIQRARKNIDLYLHNHFNHFRTFVCNFEFELKIWRKMLDMNFQNIFASKLMQLIEVYYLKCNISMCVKQNTQRNYIYYHVCFIKTLKKNIRCMQPLLMIFWDMTRVLSSSQVYEICDSGQQWYRFHQYLQMADIRLNIY